MEEKKAPNFALDSSYVMCSCAKEVPNKANKFATENFDCYRLLRVTDDNNGVFGNDSPMLRDIDCVPYVNLDPFQFCQSDHYVETLYALASNVEEKMKKYQADSLQYLSLQSRYQQYNGYISEALQEGHLAPELRPFRRYYCVLELLDSWFHVDDKTLISNKMTIIIQIKSRQMEVAGELEEKVSKIRRQIVHIMEEKGLLFDISLSDSEEKPLSDFKNMKPKIDRESAKQGLQSTIDKIESDRLKAERRLKLQKDINTINKMLNDIQDYIEQMRKWAGKKPSIYKARNNGNIGGALTPAGSDLLDDYYLDDIDGIIQEARQMQKDTEVATAKVNSYKNISNEYGLGEELLKLVACLSGAKEDIKQLIEEIQSLKNDIYERPVVTEDSYLVCRCGGIIRIVQNGNWQLQNRNQLYTSIIDMLSFMEEDLYLKQNPNLPQKSQFSLINAFNLVHSVLLNICGDGGSRYDFILNEECEKSGGPRAEMKITIRPAEDLLKQAKNGEAAKAILTSIGGKAKVVGRGFTILFAMGEIIEERDWKEGIPDILDVIIQYVVDSGKFPLLKIVTDMSSIYSIAESCIAVLEAVTYSTYACFTGEIKAEIITQCFKFSYVCQYDMKANRVSEYKTSSGGSTYLNNPVKAWDATVHYKIFEDGQYITGESGLEDFLK